MKRMEQDSSDSCSRVDQRQLILAFEESIAYEYSWYKRHEAVSFFNRCSFESFGDFSHEVYPTYRSRAS